MTLEEFLERVEHELRLAAEDFHHETQESRGSDGLMRSLHAPPLVDCQRCRLERLADEAADRAAAL